MGKIIDIEDRLFNIWDFEWPRMTLDQAEGELHFLEDLLKDIEDNPSKYESNMVKLAVVSEDPSGSKTEVCILPYRAFQGYVEDAIFKLYVELFGRMVWERL